MTEDKSTHNDFGYLDHHHVGKAKQTPLDPNYRVDPKVIQGVWDIIQGKVTPSDELPVPADHMLVEVPFDYVHAVAFFVTRELKRRGSTAGFSVKVDPDAPQVLITWIRPGGLVTPGGNGFESKTNCMAAYMSKLDPEHVGQAAVEMFLRSLEAEFQSN